MKNIIYLLIMIMMLLACQSSTNSTNSDIPNEIEYWPLYYQEYRFDVNQTYIYTALEKQGLWRRPVANPEGDWEYMGFYNPEKNYSDGAYDVIISGSTILVARGLNGLWRSVDEGLTWTRSDTGIEDSNSVETLFIETLSRSYQDPETIIALPPFSKIFLSYDVGKTWQKTSSHASAYTVSYKIFWHPFKADEFWMTYWYDTYGSVEIYHNNSEPFHFFDVADIDSSDCCNSISSLVFDREDPEHVMGFTLSNVLETFDGGLTWAINNSLIPDSLKPHYMPVVGEDTNKSGFYFLFVRDYEGENDFVKDLYYTDDYFKTLKRHPFFDTHSANVNSGHRIKVFGDHLFIGTDKGIYQIALSEFD